jgi:HD superfamily phosphohydrolase
MYMQVYLHKTVLSADALLRKIFERVQFLIENGEEVPIASEPLAYFISSNPSSKKKISDQMMKQYLSLDDNDIFITIKGWRRHSDKILADLSDRFMNRRLFRTSFSSRKEREHNRKEVHQKTMKYLKKNGFPYDDESVQFYYEANESYSEAYKYENESIWILEDGKNAIEFSKAADTKHIIALTKPVVKPYLVHLKEL